MIVSSECLPLTAIINHIYECVGFVYYSLPLVEAGLRESMRLETLVPVNVPHRALRDTKVGGYDLPKVCLIFEMFTNTVYEYIVKFSGRIGGNHSTRRAH